MVFSPLFFCEGRQRKGNTEQKGKEGAEWCWNEPKTHAWGGVVDVTSARDDGVGWRLVVCA